MLVLLVASTILREGTEIILLIYSLSSTETTDSNSYIYGMIIGASGGLTLENIIYLGLIKFARQQIIFKISSILLMLIAGGFAAQTTGILTSCDFITAFSNQLWGSF